MKFIKTCLPDLYIIEPELLIDERGFFARTYCRKEFESRGLNPNLVQCNISFNKKKATLRGMHYQAKPYEEAKLVRCTTGRIYDVAVDLRSDSPTFMQWAAVDLSAENRKMLYIPEGFAHGFQTLEDDTEVFYQMSEFYHSQYAKGFRWDDPSFTIKWPLAEPILSTKDLSYPLYKGPFL